MQQLVIGEQNHAAHVLAVLLSVCSKKLWTKAGNIPSTHVRRQDATEWGVVVRDGPILHHMWVQTCQSNVSSSKLCPLSYGTFPHGKPKCSAPWRSFRIPSSTGCGCRGSAQGDCLPQDCYNLPADGLLAAPLATIGIPDLFQLD